MKLTSALLLAAASTSLLAQTASTPARKPATTTPAHTAAAHACSKLPPISPKVPALPSSLPCAKPLYSLTTIPSVKLGDVSPMEGPGLRETLGLSPVSFSLDYVDIKAGTGPLAAPHMFYTINYTGYLTDGTKFDSSLDHTPAEPITIPYGQHQVIPGWDTGFDGMRVGGKRRLFVPWQLAYGTQGKGPIPPRAELIFDVELVAQSATPPPPPPAPKAEPAPPAAKAAPATPPASAPGATSAPPVTDPTKPTVDPNSPAPPKPQP